MTVVKKASKWGKKFWQDLGERVGATAVATFISAYVAAANVAHLDWVNALEITGTAAGLTLLKGLLANLATGSDPSASLVAVSSTKVGETVADPVVEDPDIEDHED